MIFDLRGKRRRTVQITYLALAVLMGLGAVGFGIGGSGAGGIFDALTGSGSGGSTADKAIQKKIDAANLALRRNPKNEVALAQLTRGHYQLATLDQNQRTGAFGANGKKQLTQASAAWDRYLAANPKNPDESLASVMLVVFSSKGLKQPKKAMGAAEVVATAQKSPAAYLRWSACATLAGQTRVSDLAAQRAVALAPKEQRGSVKQQVPTAKSPKSAAQFCG